MKSTVDIFLEIFPGADVTDRYKIYQISFDEFERVVESTKTNKFDFQKMQDRLTEVLQNETKENVLKWLKSKYEEIERL